MTDLERESLKLAEECGPDAAERAVRHFRDREFAKLLTAMIGIAAQTDADELRKALASVFDLESVTEVTKRANQRAIVALEKAEGAERMLRSLESAIESAAKRLDGINYEMDRFAARMQKAKTFLEWLRDVATKLKPKPEVKRGEASRKS